MGKRVYNKEFLDKVLELHNMGYTDPQIANQLGKDRRQICYIRRKLLNVQSIRNWGFKPDSPEFSKKLELSNMKLISSVNKGTQKHPSFEVQCNNCNKVFLKNASTFGKTKCQCFKGTKESYNFSGHHLISNVYFNRCKKGAYTRGLTFELSIEDMWNQWIDQKELCALSGIKLEMRRNYRNHKEQTASLDRINSKLGYIKGNIQWVHKDINKMKSNYSDEYFIEMCRLITINKIKKK